MKNNLLALGLIAILMSASSSIFAQNPAPPGGKQESAKPAEPAPARSGIIPLRLLLVVSRFQGEKKISSLPYSLAVTIGGPPVRFRMLADVPYSNSPDAAKAQSHSYKTLGVGIDVGGQLMVEPGLYKMDISVSDSSFASSNQVQGSPAVSGVPLFRNFNTNGSVLLRDAQTAQLATAADPITGETMRVDVTVTVVK